MEFGLGLLLICAPRIYRFPCSATTCRLASL